MIEKASGGSGGNVWRAWEALRAEAATCTRCPLYEQATQTVFGEGPIEVQSRSRQKS